MKGVLVDVNLLLAFAWDNHQEHSKARSWLTRIESFSTCPITELGFLRVSMSPAYCASFTDAMKVVVAIQGLKNGLKIDDDFDVTALPKVSRYKDTTDAYLVNLAHAHGLRFATLDKGVLSAKWASNIAFNPL